ncbi:MAG: tRNA (N6-isopentenyl adenosine(37)-C2)-methylthiotransferase MiaB [Proteobacteria bacterium]|nr:tRNA (N6-isopentenyl adenosine(37)-C2)-methylthiotransferase MiaB [Pseudomonadota bacterium]
MSEGLFVKTFGCQMNEYDSGKMVDLLEESCNLSLVDSPEKAQVVLVNTCSVRDKAQEKLFHQLGRWALLKKNNPSMIIAVGGCVASQEGEQIWERAPYVDIVFGPQTLHRLPELIGRVKSESKPVIDVSFPEIEKFDRLPASKKSSASAYVSIMEGCSKYCSFCVVPYTRGEEFSRPFDDVISEIHDMATRGVREIVLLGQNVNAYRGPMLGGKIVDLSALIRIVAAIDGIDRIRFTTSHPIEFTDRLIAAYQDIPELANHLHLPVQSGSDRILSLMKRGYMVAEYKSIIRKLRKVRPDISISSDFIIGFPGETHENFEETLRLISDVGFDQSFSFIYSARPGTPAASLVDDVPMVEKKHRLAILQREVLKLAQEHSKAMIGSTQKVLITGRSKKDPEELTGRTENQRAVNFAAEASLIGQFVDVVITESLPNSLRGVYLSEKLASITA